LPLKAQHIATYLQHFSKFPIFLKKSQHQIFLTMQLIAISTVLATLSLGALGAALPEAASLKARANSGVYICTDVNFSGQCIHLSNPFGDCGMFPSIQTRDPTAKIPSLFSVFSNL